MAFEAGTYLIRVQSAPEFILGVSDNADANSPVLLATGSFVNTNWLLSETDQLIRLASNPTLVITVQDNIPGEAVPLTLAHPMEDGASQQWDWLSANPSIVLSAFPGYCLENGTGTLQVGNVIEIGSISGDASQAWALQLISSG